MSAHVESSSPSAKPIADQRPIGLPTLVLLVIASMIGIGCFVSSGFALLALGNPSRVILAWILCGVWAIAGAIGYGALVRRLPLSGGEYLYLTRLMHPSIGFLAGWISLVAGFTVPITAMSKTAVQYALPDLQEAYLAGAAASLIIAVAVALHAAQVHIGATAQNLIVAVKLCLIALLLVLAGWQWNDAAVWPGHALAGRDSAVMPDGLGGYVALLASMSWISLSYTGFNAAVYVAGESKQAQRNVPRAMFWATLLVMAIYVAINAVFVFAADTDQVAKTPATIAILAAANVGGSKGQLLLRAIVVLAVLSSVFSMLMAGPRVYAQMARDGVMPKFLDFSRGVPRVAIILQGILSIAVVWISTIEQLIGYLGMTLSACSALAVASLWSSKLLALAKREPTLELDEAATLVRSVRWWEHLAAGVYVLGTIAMLVGVLADGQKQNELWAMCATFAVGAVVYGVWKQMGVKGSTSEWD